MDHYYFLTTIDNPFNPFKEFDSWYATDIANGHNTCGVLNSRVEELDEHFNSLPRSEQNSILSLAIDNIIDEDPFDIYVKLHN